MNHIGAAIVLAQPVVGRAGVEQQRVARRQRVGGAQQIVGGKIGDDEAGALVDAGRAPVFRPERVSS